MRRPSHRIVHGIIFTLCLLAGTLAQARTEFRDGDLIFQKSRSSQSLAIQLSTHSPYSHMGMVLYRDGKPYVYEASATVRYTSLAKWIARGEGGHYVAKRLRNADTLLTPTALTKLRHQSDALHGKPYDLTFEWSDERMYCSELVWKIYQRALGVEIGSLQKIKDFDLSPAPVKAKLRERYGDRIPMNEPAISPVAIFDSPLLFETQRR